jgi:hypothetical protein
MHALSAYHEMQRPDRNNTFFGRRNLNFITNLQCLEIFDFRIFHQIFQKFMEIFAAQSAPLVLLTPVANGKNLQSEKF